MKKTEFQLNGNLYRRNPDGTSWANRYVSLSTDTGTMKFYVEKSGKRTLKGQVNIRQGRLEDVDQATAGRAFAFAIINETLGTSEDANIVLAAPDQTQFEEWRENVGLCFTIGLTRRRKSLMATDFAEFAKEAENAAAAPPAETSQPSATVASAETTNAASSVPNTAAQQPLAMKAFFPESEPVAAPVVPAPAPAPKPTPAPTPAVTTTPAVLPAPSPSPDAEPPGIVTMTPSFSEKKRPSIAMAFLPVIDDPPTDSTPPLSQSSQPSASMDSPSVGPPADRTPGVKFSEADEGVTTRGPVMDAFRRTSVRKSFKAPSFKNILTPKEAADDESDEIKAAGDVEEPKAQVSKAKQSEEPQAVQKQPEPAPIPINYNPLDLNMENRPTELARAGNLLKLDAASKDIGEDSWINQYVTLDVSTGILEYFAEIAGRRILRGKVDINEATIKTIDYVYYGRLFSFKIMMNSARNLSNNQQQESIIFSAEELESLTYWLISFQDCKEFKEDQDLRQQFENEQNVQAALDAKQAADDASKQPPMSPVPGPEEVVRLVDEKSTFTPFTTNRLFINTNETAMNDPKLLLSGERGQVIRDTHSGPMTEPHPRHVLKIASSKEEQSEDLKNKTHHHHQHGLSYEYPSPAMHRTPSFHSNDAGTSAGDLEGTLSRAGSNYNNVTSINETNLDELFSSSKGGLTPPRMSFSAVSDADGKVVGNIQLKLTNVKYPADRLARRIRMWYCSSGFALTNDEEIETFVKSLRESDDGILRSFAEERFDQIKDWATLLDQLRKYESKAIMERKQLEHDLPVAFNNSMTLYADATLPERSSQVSKVAFNSDKFDLNGVAKQFARDLKVSEVALQQKLPSLLCAENHIWGQGLKSIQDEMIFAEDLMLYQEEVIRQFIEDQASMKVMVHQKDELINQLYKQISELQEYRNASQLSDGAFSPLFSSTISLNRTVANNLPLALQLAVPPAPKPTNIAALGSNTVFSNSNAHPSVQSALTHLPHSAHELQAIADREFNIADRDGDGRISREEWRLWIMDKHNLLSEHNHVKSVLMSEIRNLRKALNPNTSEIFNEIKKTEENYKAVEEELVKLYIERDTLKAEFTQLQETYTEMEVERTMVENDWQERYNALLTNLGARNAHATLNGDKGGLNPYGYNYQEDRALGLDTSSLHPETGESVSGRPEAPGFQNLDLVNLASANLATLGSNPSATPSGSNANPNTHMIYIPANALDGNVSGGTSQAGHSYAYYSSTEEKRRDSPHTIMTTTTNTNYHPPSQSETHMSRDVGRYQDDQRLGNQQQYPQDEMYYAQQLAAQAPYAATLGEGYGGQNGMYWMSHQGGQDLSHPLRAALKYDIQARQAAPVPGASPYTTVLLKKVLKDRGRSGFEAPSGGRMGVTMNSQGRQSSPPRGSSPQRFMQKTDSWAKKSLNPADKDKKDKDSESEKDMARGVVNWKYNLRNMKWG